MTLQDVVALQVQLRAHYTGFKVAFIVRRRLTSSWSYMAHESVCRSEELPPCLRCLNYLFIFPDRTTTNTVLHP